MKKFEFVSVAAKRYKEMKGKVDAVRKLARASVSSRKK